MSALVDWFRVQTHRAYVYRVLTALGVLLGVLGIVTNGQAEAVLLFIGVVLSTSGTGLATANTTTKP